VSEVSAQLDALGNAIEAGDAVLARRLAHAVKGNGSYLGATELVARCAELEALAHAGTLAPAPELLAAAWGSLPARGRRAGRCSGRAPLGAGGSLGRAGVRRSDRIGARQGRDARGEKRPNPPSFAKTFGDATQL
jgi:hypothetical protein